MILIYDNFDSFTYNLVDYFRQTGSEIRVVRNNTELQDIEQIPFNGIVLSPGPEKPDKAGNMMDLIGRFHNRLPILGICLGHQALGSYFGAVLSKALQPMHGKISRIYVEPDYIFQGIKTDFNVVRYHSLILSDLPEDLESIARTVDDEIMAIRHTKWNIRGVQFHPEAALSDFGLELLGNWVTHNSLST